MDLKINKLQNNLLLTDFTFRLENIYFKIQLGFVLKAILTIDFFLETDTVDVNYSKGIYLAAKYKTAPCRTGN
jgi:hypothetical protein